MLNVCPADTVAVPIETMWQFLKSTATYDSWWDAHTDRLDPPGPAQPGQTLYASTREFGRTWHITLQIEAVDEARHQLQFKANLIFGMAMTNRISCAKVNDALTRVQFG